MPMEKPQKVFYNFELTKIEIHYFIPKPFKDRGRRGGENKLKTIIAPISKNKLNN